MAEAEQFVDDAAAIEVSVSFACHCPLSVYSCAYTYICESWCILLTEMLNTHMHTHIHTNFLLA